ncbi:hypothetical protein [Tahibacter soli]|uniref:Uncharacterized protein n=1 Tax=Tahibacter soli TaxID=2983605 RepID=A0A9X3YJY0_9GAMM|nr:hypothetical protein [Tahibacter soli]MDC8012934.1 hypothetical protein [Tahibacter soli]
MSAATQERNTIRRAGNTEFVFGVGAGKKIYAGTIAVLAATGYAEAGTTATGKRTVGVAQETVDNTGGAAGDVSVRIKRGIFPFSNSAAADAITNGDYGTNCYVADDQTVAKTDAGGTRSIAGVVRGVDAVGVWVEF